MPDYNTNIWFDSNRNQFHIGVLASVNDIVLLDRRKLNCNPACDLSYKGGSYKWVVYNSVHGRKCGEWEGFKTLKGAIERLVHLSLRQPNLSFPKKIDDRIEAMLQAKHNQLESQ